MIPLTKERVQRRNHSTWENTGGKHMKWNVFPSSWYPDERLVNDLVRGEQGLDHAFPIFLRCDTWHCCGQIFSEPYELV
jgi:hypothetical protein